MRQSGITEEQYLEAHAQGWDDGIESLWTEPVCSACGSNHDRDESAMCKDGEVVSFREWVESKRA